MRRTGWNRAPHWFSGRAYPLKIHLRSEIFATVIRWHTPCRGGYHAARLFPLWGNNVGAKRRQCNTNIFLLKFRGYNVETWYICNIVTLPAKSVLLKNMLRWRADTIRPYELKIFESFANYAPGGTGRRIGFLNTSSWQAFCRPSAGRPTGTGSVPSSRWPAWGRRRPPGSRGGNFPRPGI